MSVPLPDLGAADPLAELGDFTGVARLDMGASCTGTVIDTGVEEGPAYLITNGHCTGDVGRAPQAVTVGEEWFGQAFLLDTHDNPSPLMVTAEALEYSTMRGRDVAIVRLQESLGELKALGIVPIPIIDEEPAPGTAVRNIAAPVQGLDWDDWVLRSGDCTLTRRTDLLEFRWLWAGSWANDCPGVRMGSSGSPLLTLDDEGGPVAITAVINTTTWGSTAGNGGLCSLNRPCEFTDKGLAMVEETSYATSAAGVGRCIVEEGIFLLWRRLPAGGVVGAGPHRRRVFRGRNPPDAVGAGALRVPISINLAPADFSALVRTALVELTDFGDCTDPAATSTKRRPSPLSRRPSNTPGTPPAPSAPRCQRRRATWRPCAVAGGRLRGCRD